MKLKWQRALGEYLQKRQALKGLVILMDIRHPLKDLDRQMIQWSVESGICHFPLTTESSAGRDLSADGGYPSG